MTCTDFESVDGFKPQNYVKSLTWFMTITTVGYGYHTHHGCWILVCQRDHGTRGVYGFVLPLFPKSCHIDRHKEAHRLRLMMFLLMSHYHPGRFKRRVRVLQPRNQTNLSGNDYQIIEELHQPTPRSKRIRSSTSYAIFPCLQTPEKALKASAKLEKSRPEQVIIRKGDTQSPILSVTECANQR